MYMYKSIHDTHSLLFLMQSHINEFKLMSTCTCKMCMHILYPNSSCIVCVHVHYECIASMCMSMCTWNDAPAASSTSIW